MSYFVCRVYSSYTHSLACKNTLHAYKSSEGPHISHLPPPPPSLTSLGSGLASLTSSTTPELTVQVNSVTSQTHNTQTHAVSSDLALIAEVWTENGRCEKIKCVSLTFTKGQLGLVPDLEIIFQRLHHRMLDVNKSDRRGTSRVSLKMYSIWALV